MEYLLSVEEAKKDNCPEDIINRAIRAEKTIKKIVWDKKDYYNVPKESLGYTQWSIRPAEQGDGCDGTLDMNYHLIGIRLCEQIDVDYIGIYESIERSDNDFDCTWLRNWYANKKKVKLIESETIIPRVSQKTLRYLLQDLQSINHSSLLEELSNAFERLGYNMQNYWEDTILKSIS